MNTTFDVSQDRSLQAVSIPHRNDEYASFSSIIDERVSVSIPHRNDEY